MRYEITYDKGYLVSQMRLCDDGHIRYIPLRKFKHQGHAIAFRDYDLSRMDDARVRMFARTYKENDLYIRYKRNQYGKRNEL
jgi:hypothetical protein